MAGFDLEKAMARRQPRFAEKIAERPVETPLLNSIRQQRKTKFAKVPLWWMEKLAHTRNAATLKIAWELLYRHWKAGADKPVVLPNVGLVGVSRRSKWRGLAELEKLGLITIERRSSKSPLITVLVDG